VKLAITVLRTVGRASVAVLCASMALDAHGASSSDADRVLADLSAWKDELLGYKITVIETNVTFQAKHPAIEALRAHPEMRDKLEHMLKNARSDQTNIVSHVYSFQENAVWIESLAKDHMGKPVHRETQAGDKQEIFSSLAFLDVPETVVRSANNITGEISRPEKGPVPGVPLWLGRGKLGEWLRDASAVTCSHGTGRGGEDGLDLNVTSGPSVVAGPNLPCRLLLRASDLTPLEFDIYGPNGAVQYGTEIQFGDCGHGLFLCKRATTRVYNGTLLYKVSTWQLISAEPEKPREPPTVASFFSEGTQISDKRFSRPLTYRLGLRPPTEAEIQRMLTNKTGVPLYEAATLPIHPSASFRARQVVFVIGAIIILFGGPVLVVWLNKVGRPASR
jgi:hypothetical protein